MVKTIGVIAALLIFTPVCSASIEASSEQSGSSWIVTDTNFMKLFFTSSWGKIKNISPKPVRQTFGYTIVTTAGIRGAESVDTLLNPYWKDDLSDDQKYKDEVEMFTRGHELATGGDIKNAIIAF